MKDDNRAKGANFGKKRGMFSNPRIFHPTATSVALANAGVIPAPHIIADRAFAFDCRAPVLRLLTAR